MQLHMQAVMWRQMHAKPRGGETSSKPEDTSANKKPEEKQKWFSKATVARHEGAMNAGIENDNAGIWG